MRLLDVEKPWLPTSRKVFGFGLEFNVSPEAGFRLRVQGFTVFSVAQEEQSSPTSPGKGF